MEKPAGVVDACLSLVANRVHGLRAILVSDRDGITIMRYPPPEETEKFSSPGIEAAFSIAADQASKIYMGKCQSITAIYAGHVLVQINDAPLVISLVADVDSNVGALIGLAPGLRDSLAPLRDSIKTLNGS